jgi:putative ABC transport system permease protein
VWSRVRHRRLQALSLVTLAALLTTSLCLGPLYQRAMEQALTGSVLRGASIAERSITLTSRSLPPTQLGTYLPGGLTPYFDSPVEASLVTVTAPTATDGRPVVGRVYAAVGFCDHVRTVAGRCPQQAREVMVSHEDATVNGWRLAGTIPAVQVTDSTFPGEAPPAESLTVVGIYEPVDDGWLGAPLTGRVGLEIKQPPVSYIVTDDWLTVPDTLLAKRARWFRPTSSASWPLNLGEVDVDALMKIGPQVQALHDKTLSADDEDDGMLLDTDLHLLAHQVSDERGQARTTVGVLMAQLVVLVGIVLWMVLGSATDDRRRELALARLRGRGRRGAASYLLAELLPVCLTGVGLGVAAAPGVMALVAWLVFPLPVPTELRWPLAATAAGAVLGVAAVVVAAARRAGREPVDSLLRGVPARRPTGAGEIVVITFSITAVVALVTLDFAGPLATLAPTLLAVAAGLLLALGLRRSVLALGAWLLRRGRPAAGAGALTSIRRPAARRVLVMVVVASALVVFCCDALVTGQRNRQHAAEQASGAPYVLAVRPADLETFVAALASVDPSGTRLTPVVTLHPNGGKSDAPTLAVAPEAWARVAGFPLYDRSSVPWRSILAPQVPPVEVSGDRLRGTVEFSGLTIHGNAALRDVLRVVAQLRSPDGGSEQVDIAPVPARDGRTRIDAELLAHPGWILTGLGLTSANTIRVSARIVFSHVTLDGQPLDLGGPGSWRPATYDDGGSVVPTSDGAGHLGMVLTDAIGAAQPMLSEWVPDPVPALVSSPEADDFMGPGLSEPILVHPAGTLPRVAGAPPGSRVVDLNGLLRRSDSYPVQGASTTVWGDDRGLMDRAADALRDRGIPVDHLTTQAEVRRQLDDTPAAWSLALSILVGSAAVLVAALVMLVVTASTWRARAADLAALRMTGLRPRRLRRLELAGTLPVVVVGCLVGALCGVVAARLALPDVRQFTAAPAVSTTDFSVPWAVVGTTWLAAALVLAGISVCAAAWTVRQSRLAQLRQTG